MKVQFLHELVDYLHRDKEYSVRQHILNEVAKTVDNNKGFLWEKILEKAMMHHTSLLGGNTHYRDFTSIRRLI